MDTVKTDRESVRECAGVYTIEESRIQLAAIRDVGAGMAQATP